MHAFLFTDIEASTRLWEEHPAAMPGALERHDAIMRDAVAGFGGKVMKSTGDGVVASFERVPDAVGAAATVQRVIQSEDWGATPIRVRMGVHAGDTHARDGDHFGPVMNRAARIMAAGHGGQILLSSAAAAMAGDVSLRDLGSHRLKDLIEAEHLYQLLDPELYAEFPDVKSLDAQPNNLPLQATELIGRAEELAALARLLAEPGTRLLTLVGPGGTGKTRLSLQAAADASDEYPDGVWFVDLSADTHPDAAFETVVRALALPVSGTGGPLDALKARLRDKKMLLVLDNFEQVIDAGPGVAELLQSAADLKIMITSRETLRVRGEKVYPVPPLHIPEPSAALGDIAGAEAVRLFVERAQAISPDFELSSDNAAAVAGITRRLDGLPLAIELAAARLNLFTPDDLSQRLGERLDVLSSGGRDVPERQRTLWGAIGWSYQLLTEEERAVFDAFSMFSGADLAAVEAVASGAVTEANVLDALGSLVDKSLVKRSEKAGSARFSMLQMIKEYGGERLAADTERAAAVAAAHAAHYSSAAAAASELVAGDRRQEILARLELDLDNLRSAWAYWRQLGDRRRLQGMFDALWFLHTARGWYHGAIELADDMLAALVGEDPSEERDAEELRLRIRAARALMALHGYDLEVEQMFSRALELAESVGSAEEQAPVLRSLATYYLNSADVERALEIGEHLLALAAELDDEAVELEARTVIANAVLFLNVDLALDHFEHVIEHHDPVKHRFGYQLGPDIGVVARMASAFLLWSSGRLDSAVRRVQDALENAAAIDHPYSLVWATYHSGYFAMGRGHFEDVKVAATRLAALARDYPLWRALASVLEGVAVTAAGDAVQGVPLTEQGVTLYQGLAPPPIFWPLVLGMRAAVFAMAGDATHALELLEEAIAIMGSDAVPPEMLVQRGDMLHMLHGPEHPAVAAAYVEAIALAQRYGLRLPELQAQVRLVRLRRELGESDDGAGELAQLLATFTEGADEGDVVAARLLLGEV